MKNDTLWQKPIEQLCFRKGRLDVMIKDKEERLFNVLLTKIAF